MTTLKTPPLNAKGLYTVNAPYTLAPNTLYTCRAIRSFQDLVDAGIDILASFYTPVGLTASNYQADMAAGANIITLMADAQPTLHVPDSYIANFPDMGNVAYNNVIVSLALGPVPDYLDLTFVLSEVATAASNAIGLTPVVSTFIASTTGVISQAQADVAETARQAAIVNRTTDYAKLLALQSQYTALQSQYAALEAIVIAAGLAQAAAPAPAPAPQ
jgi:hypothetical protein